MLYIFVIVIIVILYVAKKNRENGIKNDETKKIEIIRNEEQRKSIEKEDVLTTITQDRICKYRKTVVFVINKNKLLNIVWSEDGKELYHNIISSFNYESIEYEEDIRKTDKEYKKISEIRQLLIQLYDIIIPDISKLEETVVSTIRSINIAKNVDNNTVYIQVLEKYLKAMKNLLDKANQLYLKYNSFIKEIYAQYELEVFEATMNTSIIDRNIDYKDMEENLKNQYQEYTSYKKIYEDLSKEIRNTF